MAKGSGAATSGGGWASTIEAGGAATAVAVYNRNAVRRGRDATGAAVLEAVGGAVVAACSDPVGFLHNLGLGAVVGAITSMVFGA
jgi:hypothetical protein